MTNLSLSRSDAETRRCGDAAITAHADYCHLVDFGINMKEIFGKDGLLVGFLKTTNIVPCRRPWLWR